MKKLFRIPTLLTLTTIMTSFALSSCNQAPDKEYYYEQTRQLALDAKIPVIQLYYKNPHGEVAFTSDQYDSLKIGADDASIFQMASLSKTVFSYIVLRMYDRGEIDLDKPLIEYTDVEKFNDQQKAGLITARMVLTHTSGLDNWASAPSRDPWPTTKADFILEPGVAFSYSGEAYAFLQRAVEKIKRKTLQQIAEEEVFIPLDMPNTSYGWMDKYDQLAIDGYSARGKNLGTNRHPRENAGYTLRSNAIEYAKFIDALIKGRGLKPETHKLFFSPDVHAIRYHGFERECDKNIYWGMGIGLEKNEELGDIFFHWGDNGEFKAMYYIIPSLDSYLVYTTNSGRGHDIISKISSLYFGTLKDLQLDSWVNQEVNRPEYYGD